MNRSPDVERVFREYLADDGGSAPEYVLDLVADRIAGTRQRRTWPLIRRLQVNTSLKVAAALAAVLIFAVVGYNLLPGQAPVGGQSSPSPTSNPTLTPTPTATPTAVGIQDVPDSGVALAPGQWRFRVPAGTSTVSVVADIPAGWRAVEGQHGLENTSATNSPPAGLAILFEAPAHGMFSDPCHWNVDGSGRGDQEGNVAVGPKVADLVAALRANTSFTSSAPTPVAFGAYSGQQLELTFPADLDPATCDRDPSDDQGTFRVMPDTIYTQGKANIWRMSIVDIAGTRFVTIIEYFPGTAPAKLAEAQAIVESFELSR